jgi:HEPN domain-containing protein
MVWSIRPVKKWEAMPERSQDWFRQAKRDLESAKTQLENGFFEWACFIAQQATEKSVKAVYQKLGAEAWGRSVTDLLRGIGEKVKVSDELIDRAKYLDKFYIPARYPNGWPSGIPAEYITRGDAQNAICNSEKILQFCESLLVK